MARLGILLVLAGLVAASQRSWPAWGAVRYTSGVASGDVTETGVMLWTRVDQAAALVAHVALDGEFQQLFILTYDRWEGYLAEREGLLQFIERTLDRQGDHCRADRHPQCTCDPGHLRPGAPTPPGAECR